MIDQDLELQITRLIDNDLNGEERAHVEALIASDPEARRLFEQHENLATILDAEPDLGAVNWDRLATSISDNIDEAEREQPEVLFSFKWSRPAVRLAIAACALLVVGLGIWRFSPATKQMAAGPSNVQVAVLLPNEKTTGETTQLIEIGPSADFAATNGDLSIQEAIVSPPTRVAIDSAVLPAQDTDRLPY